MKQLLQKQAERVRGGDMSGSLASLASTLVALGVALQSAKATKPPSDKQSSKKSNK